MTNGAATHAPEGCLAPEGLSTEARDAAGNAMAANGVALFTVDTAPPGSFSLTGPSSPTIDFSPDVTWTASAGGQYYYLRIASDSNCSNVIQSYDSLTVTSVTLSNLNNGSYFVCLRAEDQAGNQTIASNNPFSFEVASFHAPEGAIVATLNPSDKTSGLTLSDGDLTASTTSTAIKGVRATIGKLSGKWYFEVRVNANGTSPNNAIGLATTQLSLSSLAGLADEGCSYRRNGEVYCAQSATLAETFASYGAGDVIGVAYDAGFRRVYFSKNGVWQNSNPDTLEGGLNPGFDPTRPDFFPVLNISNGDNYTANFGSDFLKQRPPSGFAEGWFDQKAPSGTTVARWNPSDKATHINLPGTSNLRVTVASGSDNDSVFQKITEGLNRIYRSICSKGWGICPRGKEGSINVLLCKKCSLVL